MIKNHRLCDMCGCDCPEQDHYLPLQIGNVTAEDGSKYRVHIWRENDRRSGSRRYRLLDLCPACLWKIVWIVNRAYAETGGGHNGNDAKTV